MKKWPLVCLCGTLLGLGACGGDSDGTQNEGDISFVSDGAESDQDGYVPGNPDTDSVSPGDSTQPEMDLPDVYVEPGGPGDKEFAINKYTAEDQKNPAMAVLKDGSFVVAWQSGKAVAVAPQDGSGWGVIVRRFRSNAAPAGDEYVAPTLTQGNQTRPALAAKNDNSFWVLWEAEGMPDGNLKDIAAKAFDKDDAVLVEEWRVNEKTDSNQLLPCAFVNSRGDLAVVWQADGSLDGEADGIYGQVFLGGSVKKAPEFRVNTYTQDSQRDPSLAGSPDGAFLVAWTSEGQDNGIGNGVYGNRYTDAAAATGEFLVNTELGGQQEKPDVARLPNGNYVVVWHSFPGQDGDGSGIYGQIYTSSGSKLGAEFRINEITVGNQTLPRVAALPDDSFVVVWQSCPNLESGLGGDTDDCGIIGRVLSGGTPMSKDFVVNQTVKGLQEAPKVASLGDGAFVVVWTSVGQDLPSEPKGYGIFGRRFPAGYKPQ